MRVITFKVGEWGFFEFELSYIKEMDGRKIREISTGTINTSGMDLSDRFFPLNVRFKNISESYKDFESNIRKYDFNGMNWPDIHRWLVNHWTDTCNGKDEREYYQKRYAEVGGFVRGFRENFEEMKMKKIGGVSLLR